MRDVPSPERTDGARGWLHAYRTPLSLTAVFAALLLVFAVTPDPDSATGVAEPTSEPTPGPHECVVCPIDQRCDAKSGRCIFLDHTPLPCVKSAKFDDEAGFCLPTGAPPAPAASVADEEAGREPGEPRFPGGSSDENDAPRQPDLPGFGNDDD